MLGISSSIAQQIDYNTKKGFVANGYDVVSYFNNEAKEGNKKIKATFDNVDYKFVSQENLNVFNANPEKYVPKYGGYCAYAIGAKGKKVSINPETFEIRDGKLYLFYNAWGTKHIRNVVRRRSERFTRKSRQKMGRPKTYRLKKFEKEKLGWLVF